MQEAIMFFYAKTKFMSLILLWVSGSVYPYLD